MLHSKNQGSPSPKMSPSATPHPHLLSCLIHPALQRPGFFLGLANLLSTNMCQDTNAHTVPMHNLIWFCFSSFSLMHQKVKCKYFSSSLVKKALLSLEQRRTCFSSYRFNELKVYGEGARGRNFHPYQRLFGNGGEKRSIGLEAVGSQALLQVITPGSSKTPEGGMWFTQGSRGLGTGFQSFDKYSSMLNVSGKLPKAARPDRIVRTETTGRPAVTWVGEMTHE